MNRMTRLLPLGALLSLNFLADDIHGVLTHRMGTEYYAPVTPGDVVRVPLLVLFFLYAVWHVDERGSRRVVGIVTAAAVWCMLQALCMSMSVGDLMGTLGYALRWLFIFLVMNFVYMYVQRHAVHFHDSARLLKVTFIVFLALPVLAAAFHITGYETYNEGVGGRLGYVGFVMNQNAISSLFVCLLPLYLHSRTLADHSMLVAHLCAGLLVGAKIIYIGFAASLLVWLAVKAWRGFRRLPTLRLSVLLRVVVIGGLVSAVLLFTPFLRILVEIFTSLRHLFEFYLSGSTGRESTVLDVVSSYRTDRLRRFLEWASSMENVIPLIFGGGVVNFRVLYGEIDWIDMIASFGIMGFLLFYGALAYILRIVTNTSAPYRRQVTAIIVLSVAVSFTSGHTFINPVVGIVLGYVIGAYLGHANRFGRYVVRPVRHDAMMRHALEPVEVPAR